MANIIVTTLADTVNAGDGVLSLREALALANGNAESDDITFAAGLAGGTLFLTSGQQLEITSTGTTIDGDINHDGTPDITIDAGLRCPCERRGQPGVPHQQRWL